MPSITFVDFELSALKTSFWLKEMEVHNATIATEDNSLLFLEYLQCTPECDGGLPPILFCHGLGSNCSIWREMMGELFVRGISTACFDLRHHGQNALIPSNRATSLVNLKGIGISQNCEDIQTVLTYLQQHVDSVWREKVVLVGHSYGGNLVLEYSLRYPESVRAAVCIDGGYIELQGLYRDFGACLVDLGPPPFEGMKPEEFENCIETWCAGWSEHGRQYMRKNFHSMAGMVQPRLWSVSHCQLLHNLWLSRLPDRCHELSIPVLLLPATEPNRTPFTADKVADVERLARAIRNCRVKWIRDCGHDIPCHRPVEAVDAIFEFIAICKTKAS